ncbi:uncharacterized protein GGS25DRAFT_518372 [Hypoxylon fragiforme]|uniref:uncharacterized protein n=1 Tax=Hypoxylon fragiforme TaxID=63214 RepID=UPI0020C63621|nr:uncharacterized protein GGS25DRAFT_518372 [Hypoxylon fragiforme]KAI2612688.1 hypothetical protein GGS25DRAFT_518372 [Hypoxylon fragiforme]
MSYQLRPPQPSPQQAEGGYDGYNAFSHEQQQAYAAQMPPPPQQPAHPHDGFARTQTWLANQPPSTMSSTVAPGTKTSPSPIHEGYPDTTTTASFDRRTLGGYSATTTAMMPPRPPAGRICGVERNHFFVVVAIGTFLFVVAIAVGLGIGLGTRTSGHVSGSAAAVSGSISSSSSSVAAISTTPTPTTAQPSTPTLVSPTPSFTGLLTTAPIICPQANNTVYVSRGSSKPFNVQCGRDYNADAGARDISHAPASTMAQCINACGDRDDCVGVGWGNYQGTYQCWMKSRLGEPNWSRQWYFAQLQDLG